MGDSLLNKSKICYSKTIKCSSVKLNKKFAKIRLELWIENLINPDRSITRATGSASSSLTCPTRRRSQSSFGIGSDSWPEDSDIREREKNNKKVKNYFSRYVFIWVRNCLLSSQQQQQQEQQQRIWAFEHSIESEDWLWRSDF